MNTIQRHHEQLFDISTKWEEICDSVHNDSVIDFFKKAKPIIANDHDKDIDTRMCLGYLLLLVEKKKDFNEAYTKIALQDTLGEMIGDAVYNITGYDTVVQFRFVNEKT